MNLLIWILFLVSGLLYSIAFLNTLIPFLSKRAYEEQAFFRVTFSAFVLHSLALGITVCRAGTLPVSSVYELFIFIAWLVVFIDLILAKLLKIKLVTFFASMIAAILILLPLMCPYFNINVDTQIKSPLTLSHIVLAGLSYAFMSLGFVFAIIQILQISALQRKKSSMFFRLLPSLNSASKYLIFTESLAAFSMLISVVLGAYAYFAYALNLSDLWLKFLAAIAIFVLQIAFVLLVNNNLLKGKLQSYFAIMLFIVSLILLFPIDYR